MTSPQQAAQALEELKQKHDAYKDALVQSLPPVFDIPVEQVEEFQVNQKTGVISGILVSRGVRYQFTMGPQEKSLELAR